MIANGELKREDIMLLQRHQQYLKQQQLLQQAARLKNGQTGSAQKPDGAALVEQQQQQVQAQLQRRQLQQQQQQQQHTQHQDQQHQRQRTFMGLTQEQLAKLTPQQRKILMVQQLRKRAKTQRFYESNEELLKKYENYPASLELHIHENHYRFGSKDTVIPKNSSTIKEFLANVARCEIPEALVDVIRDGGIQMYDGSLILKVFDHRIVERSAEQEAAQSHRKPEDKPAQVEDTKEKPDEEKDKKKDKAELKPKEYRTILRMTPLAQYDDLSMQTDSQQFHDTFALTFESEVLTACNRSINLQPILNPYLSDPDVRPDYAMVVPTYNEESDQFVFPHRKDAREIDAAGKQLEPINVNTIKYRPLHEDLSGSNSKYEQLMTILNQSYRHSNRIAEPSNEIGDEPAHFERLRFIEMWRRRVSMLKQQTIANGGNPPSAGGMSMYHHGSHGNSNNNSTGQLTNGDLPGSAAGYGGGFMTSQERAALSQQQMMSQQHQRDQLTSIGTARSNSVSTTDSTRSKVKKQERKSRKPRKPTKKQLAAQEAAAAAVVSSSPIDTPNYGDSPKRRYKRKA